MRFRTTSTQRTYRYVRLAIVGAMLFLAAGVTAQISVGGPLTSVSAAAYTPAGPVFVGSLCAVALALIALSGRSVEQGILDIAALLALVIALVPAPVESGVVSGVAVACPGDHPCIPAEVLPEVGIGMTALAVLVLVGVVAALALARLQRTLSRGVVTTASVAVLLVVAGAVWRAVAPASFDLVAHNAAAIAFFALVAVVAGIAAWRPHADGRRHARLRLAYGIVAAGIAAVLGGLVVVVVLRASGTDLIEATGLPLVFVGEALALALFAVFWIVQTAELWNDPDPSARARA